MTPTVYLASPIDQDGESDDRLLVERALLAAGCAVCNPAAGWKVPPDSIPSPSLQRANFAALRQCHGVFAVLRRSVLSVGVVLELQEATLIGVPVVLWAPDLKPSWSLAYLGIRPHTSIKSAVDNLMEGMRRV